MSRAMKNCGIPWIGEIPSHWEVSKVKHYFVRKNEKAHQDNPVILSLARSGVKIRDISTNEGQMAESYYDYNPVEVNDLLLNPMDLYSGANCSISKVQGVISPAYINLHSKNGASPRYYDYFFKTQYWGMTLFAHGRGISFDNRWTLGVDTLFNYYIPVPSSQEQQAIAAFLDKKCSEIDEMISLQETIIEELKAYKQSVITEAVCRGLNPNVPMKDSGIEWIGNIPSHWTITRLRNLGTMQNGISQGGDYFGEGFPFVSYSDVFKNYSLPTEVKGLAKSNTNEQELFSVRRGDIFFTRTSETIEEIGFSSVCLETIPKAVFAGFLIRFRPNEDTLDNLFAKYFFRSDIHRAYFVKEMNIVIRASLSQDLLKSLPVILPPKQEQQEIGVYLEQRCGEIDALISVKQSKIDALKEYKKSIIYEYITGKKEVNG